MSMGRVGMIAIVKRCWDNWRLDVNGHLPNDLKERGMADPEALPNYHYRDDGMLLWDAIRKYVADIVQGHYGKTTFYVYPVVPTMAVPVPVPVTVTVTTVAMAVAKSSSGKSGSDSEIGSCNGSDNESDSGSDSGSESSKGGIDSGSDSGSGTVA